MRWWRRPSMRSLRRRARARSETARSSCRRSMRQSGYGTMSGARSRCRSANFKNEEHMSRVRVAGFGLSLDGFGAGIEQSLDDPLGKRGPELFQWFFHTKTFCAMHGQEGGGSVDVDDV